MARPLAHRHALERRSDMLAAAIKERVDTIAASLTPKGGRAPFTRRMSAREAFQWWLKHRYDAIGMAEYNKLTPLQQQQLDTWLTEAVNVGGGGAPVQIPPTQEPNPQSVMRPAEIEQRKIEGPPVGESAAEAPFYG